LLQANILYPLDAISYFTFIERIIWIYYFKLLFYNHTFRKLSSTLNLWWCCLIQGDVDKDGYLDYGEFVAISIHLRKIDHDEHIHKAFQFFDKNQSEYIEIEELHNALADEIEKNSDEVINAIMHDVDTDKVSIFHFLCIQFDFIWV